MGSIKTRFVKRIGKELYDRNSEKFTNDYSKNKELIKGLIEIRSKKIRNIIAGYITNLKNQENKEIDGRPDQFVQPVRQSIRQPGGRARNARRY